MISALPQSHMRFILLELEGAYLESCQCVLGAAAIIPDTTLLTVSNKLCTGKQLAARSLVALQDGAQYQQGSRRV